MIGIAQKHMHRLSWLAYRKYLQSTDRPILVGPFTSEVGFEAMYWIPFVQALGLDPARLIPITRGGAAVWYDTPRSLELFQLREPKALRIERMLQHAKTGLLKQTSITPFERAILKDAAAKLGLDTYHVLHPSVMYTQLAPFWQGSRGLEWLFPHITKDSTVNGQRARIISTLPAPAVPDGLNLPPQFVAARFYVRATFPYTELSIQVAKACLRHLAAQQPVVLLNPGIHADEHVDLDITGIPNVYRLQDLCTVPMTQNLALQSAIIARAVGFVGTYGGLAQLALRLGKPSVSYYTDWHGTALGHKHLSEAISLQSGVSFLTVKVNDMPLLKAVLPELAFQAASSSGQLQQGPPPEEPTKTLHDEASVVG